MASDLIRGCPCGFPSGFTHKKETPAGEPASRDAKSGRTLKAISGPSREGKENPEGACQMTWLA